jgi:DUF1680 family protein
VDAVRGCVAIEYGPLAYCVEQADQAANTDLDTLALDTTAPLRTRHESDLLGGVTAITATAIRLPQATAHHWPPHPEPVSPHRASIVSLTAIPYALWANREPGTMRVWVPAANSRPVAPA